jgi:hypothetical protein
LPSGARFSFAGFLRRPARPFAATFSRLKSEKQSKESKPGAKREKLLSNATAELKGLKRLKIFEKRKSSF